VRVDATGLDSFFATYDPNSEIMTATYYPSSRDAGASTPQVSSWRATNNPAPKVIGALTSPDKLVYPPHFPAGTWSLKPSVTKGDNTFGPKNVPTTAHVTLPVQKVDQQAASGYSSTGEALKTWGYGIHAGGATVDTVTYGCIRMSSADVLDFARQSDAALSTGGRSTLSVQPVGTPPRSSSGEALP
jgi:hypothetical protein